MLKSVRNYIFMAILLSIATTLGTQHQSIAADASATEEMAPGTRTLTPLRSLRRVAIRPFGAGFHGVRPPAAATVRPAE
jgi:hypothetical protein